MESVIRLKHLNNWHGEKTMKLVLVRNAEHIGEQKIFWADKTVSLSKAGKGQAKLVCKRLEKEKPSAIYSSEYARAVETIKPLAEKLGLEILQRSAFNAFDMGRYSGRTQDETIEALGKEVWKEMVTRPDPNKRYFEGGETLAEEAERAWKGLQEILRKHAPEDAVVISTHLTIIGSLLCRIYNVSLSNIWLWGGSMAAEHPSITIIVHDNGRWYLQHYGCAEHLR